MKDENPGNPTSTKSWTAKSVCGKVHAQQIAEVQTCLSGGEEKILAHYGAARTEIFNSLSPEEMAECERLAAEWNAIKIPEEIQRQYACSFTDFQSSSSMFSQELREGDIQSGTVDKVHGEQDWSCVLYPWHIYG
jgi:hypothetical protein